MVWWVWNAVLPSPNPNVMHLKHECQFSLGRRTVATADASDVGNFEDRIATHWAHLSLRDSREHTQTKRSVCTVCRREVNTERPNWGGEMLAQGNAWGAVFMTARDRGPWPVIRSPSLLVCVPTNGGRKHTQSRQYHTLLTLTHLLIQSAALILCRWQCQ